MSRSSARAVRAVVGLLLVALPTLALSGAGCVEAEARFFVANFCAEGDDSECSPISEFQIPIDVACNFASETCSARLSASLVNRMTSSRGEFNNNNVETSDIIVTGYDVRLNNGLGDEETFIFNSYATIFTGDGEGSLVGFQLVPVNGDGFELLNAVNSSGESVAGYAGVRFYGRTTGGLEVETPEAFLPITFSP